MIGIGYVEDLMSHSNFQQEYSWLTGMDEYFKKTNYVAYDRWLIMYQALYHNNWWRKRDIISEILTNNDSFKSLDTNDSHRLLNLLLVENLPEVDIKLQHIVETLDYWLRGDNDFISRLNRFINYWSGDHSESAVIPDLNDFLSRGQIKSKMWLIAELIKGTNDEKLDNVIFYGGWYNFLAYDFFQQLNVGKIYSLDVNPDVIAPSKRLCYQETKDERFLPKSVNVDKIVWAGSTMRVPADQSDDNCSEYWTLTENASLVVNTSCEHMDNTWYNNIPKGTLVALQTNDYFDNEQHTNCCTDLAAAKSKYPMSSIMYSGELETFLYNRFMLIGIK
jgi:hypothetical protein